MEKIKSLNRYQKSILLLMLVMTLLFTVLYGITISREGFSYRDAILVPRQEDGNYTYSGKIQGETACFTVYPDHAVLFAYGDKTYGPYTAREDSAAIPKDSEMAESMTGVELLCGEEILFRGGVVKLQENYLLYQEDGTPEALSLLVTMSDGRVVNEYGKIIDPMEPTAYDLLDLMAGPKLTHKGEWMGWVAGVVVCIITAISILFADELFRWHLAFQISNAEDAEPSEWEITGRYVSWTILPVMALALFIMGLQ